MGRCLQQLPVVAILPVGGPSLDRALGQRKVLVGHNQVGVKFRLHPQPLAGGACAMGAVERKSAWLDLGQTDGTDGAGQVLRVQEIARRVAGEVVDDHHPIAQVQCGLDRIGEASDKRRNSIFHRRNDQSVHHRLDSVPLVSVQQGDGPLRLHFVHVRHLAVHPHADETSLAHVLKDRPVVSLAVFDQGGQDLEAGRRRQGQDSIHDLLGRLSGHFAPAPGAVGDADAGVEEAKVVIYLGDGADGGARVVGDTSLVDRDGRRKPLDLVHVGLVHLAQELAGVGGE